MPKTVFWDENDAHRNFVKVTKNNMAWQIRCM